MIRRPGAAPRQVRRRLAAPAPAAEPKRRRRRPPAVGGTVEEKFANFEEVAASDVSLAWLKPGDWLQTHRGVYGGEEAVLAGRLQRIVVEGDVVEAELTLTGTKLESLLKFATGHSPAVIRLHLCGEGCDQQRANPNLVHSRVLQRVNPGSAKSWEENLIVADELHPLRAHQEAWKKGQEAEEVESKSSTSKKKKKKVDKEKRLEGESGKKKKKKKKGKVGGKAIARKKLTDLFNGTGLDPDQKQRKLLAKKTKKRLRKAKSSTSTSDSSSSSSSSMEDQGDQLLDDKNRIQRIASLAPGLLCHQGIMSMKENINQASGTPWGLEEATIPPICLQYTRQYLLPRSSQAMSRKLLTLAHIVDYLLQGRVAEAADTACQRVKACEMVQAGQSWTTASKIELVGTADPSLASRPEIQIAAKEAQLDAKAKGTSWSSAEKGKSKGKGKDKGKDKGKEKTGSKGDAKKGS